jgi:hypothetical protein
MDLAGTKQLTHIYLHVSVSVAVRFWMGKEKWTQEQKMPKELKD